MDGWDGLAGGWMYGERLSNGSNAMPWMYVCMYVCMGIYESLRFWFGLDYPRDLYLNSKPCST